jgi:hypothetical protein
MAIVLGYSLATILFRAFWPVGEAFSSWIVVVCAAIFYLWLGLAMSGPLILFFQGTGERTDLPSQGGRIRSNAPGSRRLLSADTVRQDPERLLSGPIEPRPQALPARTWAEIAWLIIGVYWIILGAVVIPSRSRTFRVEDIVLFGLTPILATLLLRIFGPRPQPNGWTHPVAVALLATWPVAWLALILLGKLVL